MKHSLLIGLCAFAVGCTQATEYHVATNGIDSAIGTANQPLRTISAAASKAKAGDTVTVHAGTYRERVDPPRGGESNEKRITYRAAPGEKVVISGAEAVTGWKKVQDDVWTVTLPNSFFGEFNPFADLMKGSWFHRQGRDHHTGAVYLNGVALDEAEYKGQLVTSATAVPTVESDDLFNVKWLRPVGAETNVSAVALMADHCTTNNFTTAAGAYLSSIQAGDWATYEVDFGESTEHMELKVATPTRGGVIEIRRGTSPQSRLIGRCVISATGGWETWSVIKAPIDPLAGKMKICLVFKEKPQRNGKASFWFAEVDEKETTLFAQFKDVDPNNEEVEVNARQSVFYPSKPGMNYITVQGFTLECAATPWAPPNAEQIGIIGTHWSKGWIIENNTIRHSACTGVTLGKYGDEFDNIADSADGYVGTIKRALNEGNWTKENIGSHLVRNNHISHCGQAGIVGSMGCAFSTITGNRIHDIHYNKSFGGFEQAGIKFHGPIDTLISHNEIYRCGGFGGIWLDWMTQGTRVTGNLLYENPRQDLFAEVNHGPFLVDNNIFLSKHTIYDSSGGGAYVHNLFAHRIKLRFEAGRKTPYHTSNSTEIAGIEAVINDDDRFYNNLFLDGGLEVYNDWELKNLRAAGNVYLNGSQPTAQETPLVQEPDFNANCALLKKADGLYLEFSLPASVTTQECAQVTSALLGKTQVGQIAYADTDGSPLAIDTDYFGQKRAAFTAGPFGLSDAGTNGLHTLKIQSLDCVK